MATSKKPIAAAKKAAPAKKKAESAKKSAAPLSWKIQPLPKAKQYVNSVAISADGSKVIAGTYFFDYTPMGHSLTATKAFTVGVFAYTNKKKLLWKDEFLVSEGVYWVAVSRDGTWAASGGLEIHGQGFISAYNATTGAKAIDYKTPARTNMVALNTTGTTLVAGADSLYIFTRTRSTWNAVPTIIPCVQPTDSVISVAISSNGQWIIAGTLKGTVMLIKNTGGTLSAPLSWTFPSAGSVHWVAMAADGSSFTVGGSGSTLYYFSVSGFQIHQTPAWTGALTGCNSCRSVAISDDGTLVSAVANKASAGMLFVFGPSGTLQWSKSTQYSPNSTSMDSAGKFVSVADGFPDGTPGAFQLFNATGASVWNFPTSNMSWPMQICANANGIAAASDDSYIYYFS